MRFNGFEKSALSFVRFGLLFGAVEAFSDRVGAGWAAETAVELSNRTEGAMCGSESVVMRFVAGKLKPN